MPVIVHIDMNCFFASCEVKKNPNLKGKKVIVGGPSNKSVVSASSYEARRDGVYSAMPIYLAKEKCKDGIFLPVDYEYYSKVSDEIFNFLRNKYKIVEQVSIDEAYIDMSDIKITNGKEYFISLQKYIYEEFHIPCSIGVSFCRFLAKIGSDYKKPFGLTIIAKKDVPNIVYPLKINDAYGIGKQTAKRLNELGIKTIKDFIECDDPNVKNVIGNNYDHLLSCCKGEFAERITIKNEPIKSIGNSHTIMDNTDDFEVIKENILMLVNQVSGRLKASRMIGKTITLSLKDAKKDENVAGTFKLISKSVQIIEPTNDNDKIYVECLKLLDKFPHFVIRLVGVSVSNLYFEDEYAMQLSFFSKIKEKNDVELLIDKLNELAGGKVFIKAKNLRK